jgi:putative endonuclease
MGRVDPRAARGRRGEDAAAAWYRARGYRIVERNWRCPLGELDLVAARDGVLVLCEVKARTGSAFGSPVEAVTWRKQRKLRLLGEAYLRAAGARFPTIRFDVAAVTLGTASVEVEVYEGAF